MKINFLATSDFVEKAILGNGFERKKNNLIIQPIIKTKEFLSSKKLAMRLLLNALTTESIFCEGNKKIYKEIQSKALKNNVRIFYSAWDVDGITLDYFVSNLIKRGGKTGQFYLGFDDDTKVKKYLTHIFKKTFYILLEGRYLKQINNKFYINNTKWFKEINII